MRHLKTIDVLDGGGDVALAHAASVQGENLAFNGRDITLVLLDDLRLEGALTVTGHVDGDFSQGCLEGLFGVSVASIATGDRAFMVGIAEMILHLPFERRLEDGREDAFDNILDFLCVLGLVGFHDLFGDIVCRSGNHFAFCHVGKALLVDVRIELEINQQTWHLHKLLYTPFVGVLDGQLSVDPFECFADGSAG